LVWAGHAPGTNLYIDGSPASSRVFQHDGMACVPVADVARALNKSVVPKADGYDITIGGAGQLNGMNGKIGEKLSNGQWVFTVVKAFRTDKYTHQFDNDSSTPDKATDDLVVVVIRIKNARQESVGISLPGTGSTAVTDQDEHSYSKQTFGSMDDLHSYPTLLPGSAVDFAMVFSVPKTEKLDSFVYQVYPSSGPKPPTFRVSLTSLNQ
jgi:hypothetical protein